MNRQRPTQAIRSAKIRAALPLIWLALALQIFGAVAFSSNDDEIKKRQDQLLRLRNDIDSFEKRIRESEQRESATLELLDSYDRQTLLLRELISSLREEEKEFQRQIEDTRATIASVGSQVNFIKRQYGRYVRAAYKHGRTHDLELLLSARSLNQALVRARYLQRFSNQRKIDVQKLENRRETIQQQNLILQAQLTAERKLIAEKSHEETRLSSKVRQRKQLLSEIKKNKINYERELQRKRSAMRDIEKMIARLIEEESVHADREAALNREKRLLPPPEISGAAFDSRRGKLRWPVNQGRITSRFGNQQHPVLKTITQNTGIDIAVPSGTNVHAVAPGRVSTISWLPAFGNLLILNHSNGYRTVYAHLSEIDVREGETIAESALIARSGESLSGPMIHFEVWKDREKQDPEHWLRPQGVTHR